MLLNVFPYVMDKSAISREGGEIEWVKQKKN